MITRYQADIENSIMFGKKYDSSKVIDTFYIALSSTAITESGTGLTEPNDRNYKRLAIDNNLGSFTTSSSGVTKNANTWEFGISTSVWGRPITHWAIMDSVTGGRILYYDALPTPMVVDVNQVVLFNPQAITITRSGL